MPNNYGRMLAADVCTWCAHDQHADACPVIIQTGTAKAPTVVACPCARRGESSARVVGSLAHLRTTAGRTIGGAE